MAGVFPSQPGSSKDVFPAGEFARPHVLLHHLKPKALATAPWARFGQESHGRCPVLSLCSPRAGSWSGASERNGLMKWGHQEQRPGRGKIGKIALCLARSSEAAGIHLSSSILKYSQVRRTFLSSSVRGSCFWSVGTWYRCLQKNAACPLVCSPFVPLALHEEPEHRWFWQSLRAVVLTVR